MGYELLRNVAFPAIVESHITLGASYQINENLAIDLAYMHAFDKTIHSRSQGNAIQLESSLYENSLSLGLVWTFR
jgi:long-chain fatty acid transport protein